MNITYPSASMHEFASHLRINGIEVALPETLTALEALKIFNQPPTYKDAKKIMKSIFASDRNSWDSFDYLCDVYWLGIRIKKAIPSAKPLSTAASKLWQPKTQAPQLNNTDGQEAGDIKSGIDSGKANLDTEAAAHGKGEKLDANVIHNETNKELIIDLAKRLAQSIKTKNSRRYKLSNSGSQFDFRNSFRKSLATEGEFIKLSYKSKKLAKVKIAALLDVSGSMKNHLGFFLNFLNGLTKGGWHPEAFIFHTKLLRITNALLERDHHVATQKFSIHSQTFGGGTRIAKSLLDFHQRYGKKCLGRRSAVIIVSDGYDADNPEELIKSLKLLRTQTQKIIWLSPALQEVDRKSPKARSLKLAFKYIDLLAPLKTTYDLENLITEFQTL